MYRFFSGGITTNNVELFTSLVEEISTCEYNYEWNSTRKLKIFAHLLMVCHDKWSEITRAIFC